MKVNDVKNRPVPYQFIGDNEQHCVHVLVYYLLITGVLISP